jgi:hypothetical protein
LKRMENCKKRLAKKRKKSKNTAMWTMKNKI